MTAAAYLAKRKQRTRLWCVVAAFLGSLLFLLFQGGKLASMLFAIMLILSIYLLLGRWSGIRRIEGRRILGELEKETFVPAGTSVKVRIETEIPGFWPIPYVRVQDRLLRRNGGEMTFEASFVPDWRRRGKLEYTTPPLRRGFYRFGGTVCKTEDVFGLFEHSGTLELAGGFGVLPETAAISYWRQFHQMMNGMHHHSAVKRAMRETTQINGVREYHYGDRLSRIHWNATAKTGDFKSKEFERESLPRTVLVLDRRHSVYAEPEQFELAVSVAASLLEYAKKHEIAVGLLSAGKDSACFEAGTSAEGHRAMLYHLIDAEADGEQPLMKVLQDRGRAFAPGTFFAIVSPQIGEPMQQVMKWMSLHQMNGCHFCLPGDGNDTGRAAWLKMLKQRGWMGYTVRRLDELPSVLGGMA
jgi:uncharacterized protein (DUF58 family)